MTIGLDKQQESKENFSTFVNILRHRAVYQAKRKAFTFLQDGEVEAHSLTYEELDAQARTIATQLQARGFTGQRTLLLYPPGLEFIAAFFGCLYAGVVAVPVSPPQGNQKMLRWQVIASDAEAAAVLTTTSLLSNIKESLVQETKVTPFCLLTTDDIANDRILDWQEPDLCGNALAFMQYTSGSTGTPKGVMVSHSNLMDNSECMQLLWNCTSESVLVTWLPTFHDMGLIYGILQPLYTGFPCYIMAPAFFIQRPIHWLEAISRYKGTHSGAPNFAYDLCVRKIAPEQLINLDLSSWHVTVNGAEPVRAETLKRFAEVFKPCGFKLETFCPGYGLAEATLAVTALRSQEVPTFYRIQTDALQQNWVVEAKTDEHSHILVGCGRPQMDTKIAIVNPESLTACASDEVGEIWILGSSVTKGYWKRTKETEQTFRAYLADTGEGPFLRTGDLGFLLNGELFVTGRLKDVIIIRGNNYYPQDIEMTVQESHAALRPGCGAAFAVEVNREERLVVVQEVERIYLRKLNVNQVIGAIRKAVSEQQGLQVYAVLLLKTASLPKTSSGKVQRRACKAKFLSGSLETVGEWRQHTLDSELHIFSKQDNSEQQSLQHKPQTIETIRAWLVGKISQQTNIAPQDIDIREPWAHYGLDSLQLVSLSGELGDLLGFKLSVTLGYDYPSIEALAQYLAEKLNPDSASPKIDVGSKIATWTNDTNNSCSAIAIIGMGCRFPGSPNLNAFWHLLHDGIDVIKEVPPSRWDVNTFYEPTPGTPGKMNTRWGGFLEEVEQFEPEFFGISHQEAESIDLQQRLLLMVAREAIENAGQTLKQLANTDTGVFIGTSTHDYLPLQLKNSAHTKSIAANSLSYWLNLRGPSVAVDTACSSSLVAVHQACQSLRYGECKLAIAGGVNLILTPELTIAFSQSCMMAADGRCKTFDASADGYVRGEGCGIVFLKPLHDALKDGDNILALIAGSAINQDGRSNGLTAPNRLAQQSVIRQALENAKVVPAQISYVEAHGTGTALGDPIEVNSLKEVLMQGRLSNKPCWISSVKTNIGHLEAAAGIAGLIKVVLALHHEKIPPHLHLKKLNPHISLEGTPLSIPLERQPWLRGKERRLAGVSSFGFGGTNVHVILEEAPTLITTIAKVESSKQLLNLSSKSEQALQEITPAKTYLGLNSEAAIEYTCKEPIAIIGMGCRFPGGATSLDKFWRLLQNGVDVISEVPPKRWNLGVWYDRNLKNYDNTNIYYGGFLEDIDKFDPAFFGISYSEAAAMDPQQRLLLEVTWEALEKAGLSCNQLGSSQTSVFVGISSNDYYESLSDPPTRAGTGIAHSIAANRLSYFFDLRGPSIAVNTGCSSSLVAAHMACQSLRTGESNLALLGGVNLIISPKLHYRRFDDSADSYGRGEGCGVVILKRLCDARRDGDRILAVVKGSAVNHNGQCADLKTSNKLAQQAVIRRAYDLASVSPNQINYVEVSGADIHLLDLLEIQAIEAVFGEGRTPKNPCAIGSVKTNIGNLEAASGIAALIKAVLSLQHGEIPPHPNSKRTNLQIACRDLIEGISTKFEVPTLECPSLIRPRYIGVNSFDFGGTNVHMILEAPQEKLVMMNDNLKNTEAIIPSVSKFERLWHILTLSAKNQQALKELAGRYKTYLITQTTESLPDICFTANTGRSHFDYRLAIRANSLDTLSQQMDAFSAGKKTAEIFSGQRLNREHPKVVFLFSGQGSQYVGMGRQLYDTQPLFRETLEQCDELLRPYLQLSLLSVLYGTARESAAIHQTQLAQPALFALEYALVKLWQSWGIEPDAVMGHSAGEYVAACIAGIFSLEDGLFLSTQPGRLMANMPSDGKMVAIFAEETKVKEAICSRGKEYAFLQDSVSIAAINGSNQTVISGYSAAVETILDCLESECIISRPLNIPHAFHSPLVEPILDTFGQTVSQIKFRATHLPLISSRTGQIVESGKILDATYWCRQLREPVLFYSGMQTLAQAGYEIFLEVGPQDTLINMGKRCFPKGSGTWLASLKKGEEDWKSLLESLATIYVAGKEVNWSGFDQDYLRRRAELPTYPFQRKSCWLTPSEIRYY